MRLLRSVLYVEAGLAAAAGILLSVIPSFLLSTVFDLPPYPEYTWVRLTGIEAFAIAMLMVLVAHRVEELYWWSWAFVFVATAAAVLALTKVIGGLGVSAHSRLWWLLAAGGILGAVALLLGIGKAGREKPA